MSLLSAMIDHIFTNQYLCFTRFYWCKFGQKKKGNLVFQVNLVWCHLLSLSHTHRHAHTHTQTTHTGPIISPKLDTGMCGWRVGWPNKCFVLPPFILGRICFKTSYSPESTHSRGEKKWISGSFRVGSEFVVQSFLVVSSLSWEVMVRCVDGRVCGLYCTSLEMVFSWWSEGSGGVIHHTPTWGFPQHQWEGQRLRPNCRRPAAELRCIKCLSLQFKSNSSGSFSCPSYPQLDMSWRHQVRLTDTLE